MAGSATIISNTVSNRIRSIIWAWTSDASGDVSGGDDVVLKNSGTAYHFAYDQGAGVTDLYDVTITAAQSFKGGYSYSFADILGGDGADLSNSQNGASAALSTGFQIPTNTTLSLVIAAAGNVQSGIFILYVWEERN